VGVRQLPREHFMMARSAKPAAEVPWSVQYTLSESTTIEAEDAAVP
jgi:hypothetical protein